MFLCELKIFRPAKFLCKLFAASRSISGVVLAIPVSGPSFPSVAEADRRYLRSTLKEKVCGATFQKLFDRGDCLCIANSFSPSRSRLRSLL